MPTRRDPWLDNAKMVLVTIVVVGHAIVLLPTSDLEQQAYDFIYYFHIPVFVLVTGYLSRSFRYTPRHLWSLVTTLVVPYVLFSYVMAYFRHLVGGETLLDPILSNPRWPMWYLAVVVIWRLATPVLKLHPAMVPLSIVVSLVAGGTNQELLDLNRAMGLLPFFVIGLHLSGPVIERIKQRSTRIVGAVALVGLWVFADFTNVFWSTSWLYYRSSYADLGVDLGDGAWIRARLILISLVGCFAVLSLIPQRRTFLSEMGAFSLVVYLFHGFVVRYATYRDLDRFLPDSPLLSLVVVTLLAVGLALLLAWAPVATRLNYLVDPVNTVVKNLRAR